jgi:tRNA G18 (ribose-2'-O)-methylase SpoU
MVRPEPVGPAWRSVSRVDDPDLRLFTGLTDVALRSVSEPAEGVFVAEGVTVVRRAIEAGYEPISVLATAKWLRLLDAEHLLASNVPRYVADEELLRSVTGFTVHRGVLVLMRRRLLPSVTSLIENASRVVLLEDLKEHANVGTIMRAAAAFGVDAVIVSPQCADPLYRRAVKVSMGTVFQVPWTVSTDWSATLDELVEASIVVAALTPDPPAVDLRAWAAAPPERLALVFGTEGPGLIDDTLKRCSVKVRIPMAGGVDSLNVGSCAAVALYAVQPHDV